MKEQASVIILGTRGSVPVEGREYEVFGQATTCFLVRLAGQPVVVDAGTGILHLGACLEAGERELPILLTHAHVDHLLGLGMCPLAFRADMSFRIYGRTRGGARCGSRWRRCTARPCGRWSRGCCRPGSAFSLWRQSCSWGR